MFLGTFKPNLIGKGRLALPKKIRHEIIGERVVLSMGFEKCLFGFEEKTWNKATITDLNRPLSDPEGRRLRRQMCANASIVELDSQSRFVIPEELLNYAVIKEEVIIIGAGDHFEIWSPEEWKEYLS
jgi:MraZ protein